MNSEEMHRVQLARMRYAIIAATIASFAGEMTEDGTVGGFLDPGVTVEAMVEVIAAVMAKSGEYAERKDRREFADEVRKMVLTALDRFVVEPHALSEVFEPVDPHYPTPGLPGVRGTVQ